MYYKRKKYYCFDCGAEMEKEGSTLICPNCGRTWAPKDDYTFTYDDFYDSDDSNDSDDFSLYNDYYANRDREWQAEEEEHEREMRWERNRERGEWNRDNDPDFYAHCEDGWNDWED